MKNIQLSKTSADGNDLGELMVDFNYTGWNVRISEDSCMMTGSDITVRKQESMHQFIMRMPGVETHEERDKYILGLLEEIQELLNPE